MTYAHVDPYAAHPLVTVIDDDTRTLVALSPDGALEEGMEGWDTLLRNGGYQRTSPWARNALSFTADVRECAFFYISSEDIGGQSAWWVLDNEGDETDSGVCDITDEDEDVWTRQADQLLADNDYQRTSDWDFDGHQALAWVITTTKENA